MFRSGWGWVALTCALGLGCGDDDVAAELSAAECSDGVDNDGDGAIDCADVGCRTHAFCEGVDGGSDRDAGDVDAGDVDAGIDAATADAGDVRDAGMPLCPTTLVNEGFESSTLGELPTTWLGACVGAAPYSAVVTSTAHDGSRGITVDFRGTGGEAAFGVPVEWPSSGVVDVEFWVRPETTNQNIYILPVRADRRLINAVPFQNNGRLGRPDSPTTYTAGTWYRVAYELDFDTERYRLRVDGVTYDEGAFLESTLPCNLAGEDYLSIHGGFVDQKFVAHVDSLRIVHRGVECAPTDRHVLRFDGDGDEVAFPRSFGDVGRRFTFEAWVKPTTDDYAHDVGGHVFEHRADNRDFTMMFARFGEPRFGFIMYSDTSGGPVSVQAATTSALDTWHHVATVFDDGAMRVYVDGRLEGTGTLPGEIDWNPATLRGHFAGRDGADARPDRGAFIGEIDEIRISRSARYTGATLTVPEHFALDADTVALWDFDEGVGTVANDETTNALHGEIRGAAWVTSDR